MTNSELRQEWRHLDKDQADESSFLSLSRQASSIGEPLLAYDIAKEGLKLYPDSMLLRQVAALAQARGGAPLRALKILEPYLDSTDHIEDTYGILARANKDLWAKSNESSAKEKYGRASLELYLKGHELSGGYYTALNAAFMHLVLKEEKDARALALKVIQCCESELERTEGDYWLQASLAEAYLCSGDVEQAILSYRAALQYPNVGPAEIASTRQQALRIAEVLGFSEKLADVFNIPSVIVFSGHMLDAADRACARFPARLESKIKQAIHDELDRLNPGFGYSSAACGSDLIFIECMLERGAEIHIVLPFHKDDFIEESVSFAGKQWVERFEKALQKATTVRYSTEEAYLKDDVLFDLCNQMIDGLGHIRSKAIGASTHLLLVWDGNGAAGIGGTGDFSKANDRRYQSTVQINPIELLEKSSDQKKLDGPLPKEGTHLAENTPRVVRTLLFADVVGFSKLQEKQLPVFQVEYLKRVADLLQEAPELESVNTWGDGLYAVFKNLDAGADWALKFRDMVNGVDWPHYGLPEGFTVRISLHIGPVFTMEDIILKQPAFFGTHVARVARIEPITTPGCVFGTEQVAAILNASNSPLCCDYVGNISLAKRYGLYPIYQIRRTGELE
jgi:class 3 adenylate cyclase/tetratricopeptide (TPR) repeat protein